MSPDRAARHWAEIGESTFVLGILLLFWIHRLFGRWLFRVCLWPVVFGHWVARSSVRAASLDYLNRIERATGAIGHAPGALDSLRHVNLFAESLLDKLLSISGRYRPDALRLRGNESIDAAAHGRRGGVIVTAHMGCLELVRDVAERRTGVRLNILVHTGHAQQFNRLLRRLNPRADLNFIETTDVDPATAVMLDARVAAGEFVVIAGDRVPVKLSQTVDVEFLGELAPFPVGPYVLASLFKCPLYLLACVHEGGGYCAHFEVLAEEVMLPRNARAEALVEYASRYTKALTEVLARSPYDWFNFYLFWDQPHARRHARS
jgi:predicted LPLAT superfamily acyltransferase